MVFSNEFATIEINYNTVDPAPPCAGLFTPHWMRASMIRSVGHMDWTRFDSMARSCRPRLESIVDRSGREFAHNGVGQAFLRDIPIIVSGRKA